MANFIIGLAVGVLIGQIAVLLFVGASENERETDIYNEGYTAGKKDCEKM